MSAQKDINDALRETLKRTGTLDTIRGMLRADIYHCINDCLKVESDKESELPQPQENILINELIADYLAFNGYLNTLSVLAAESRTPSLLEVSGNRRVGESTESSMSLGSNFIRAELGLKEGITVSAGRRRTPMAMLYEIVETLKARNRLRSNRS